MKQQINFCEFCDAFENSQYKNNFSYDGKRALFDYLEQLEEDTDSEMLFDIVAICCDYIEYKNVEEYLNDYKPTHEDLLSDAKTENFTEEELNNRLEEEINDNTTLIKIGCELEDGFIIGAY